MMLAIILIIALYIILGIGYAKLLIAYSKEDDKATIWTFSVILWPAFLVITSFWNFK